MGGRPSRALQSSLDCSQPAQGPSSAISFADCHAPCEHSHVPRFSSDLLLSFPPCEPLTAAVRGSQGGKERRRSEEKRGTWLCSHGAWQSANEMALDGPCAGWLQSSEL